MNTEIALYVDDYVIYSRPDKIEKVINNVQTHLNKIQKWAQNGKLYLSLQKA